jgi:hypothetical protein
MHDHETGVQGWLLTLIDRCHRFVPSFSSSEYSHHDATHQLSLYGVIVREMSFGWSAGDIIAALELLHKVAVALKDMGGASSDYQDASLFLNVLTVTLQHLKALQAAPLDPNLAKNLDLLCDQVQEPLSSFCDKIRSSFERDLGAGSTRLKVLTTGRKLQWALSTSKQVKALREKIGGPIAAIGIVLSQQLV